MAIYYNNNEAKLLKKTKTFDNFTYDNETDGGCINKFTSVNKLIDDISKDVENLGTKYTELQRLYDKFTEFNDKMNSNKTSLRSSIDDIRRDSIQIVNIMSKQVESLQKNDASFISDLESINKLISNERKLDDSSYVGYTVGSEEWNKLPAHVQEGILNFGKDAHGHEIKDMAPVQDIKDLARELGIQNNNKDVSNGVTVGSEEWNKLPAHVQEDILNFGENTKSHEIRDYSHGIDIQDLVDNKNY